MKKALFILIITSFLSTLSFAQKQITTDIMSIYDNTEKDMKPVATNKNEPSIFEINAEETVIKYAQMEVSDTYFITEKDYDEKSNTYQYRVTSVNGKKSIYIIDYDKGYITQLYHEPRANMDIVVIKKIKSVI